MANMDIKLAAAGAGVKMWQIADEIGILDCNLSRKLRHELPTEEKEMYFEIIRKLSSSSAGGEMRPNE